MFAFIILLTLCCRSVYAWSPACGLEPGPLLPGPHANAAEVLELQERLQALGYFSGDTDESSIRPGWPFGLSTTKDLWQTVW